MDLEVLVILATLLAANARPPMQQEQGHGSICRPALVKVLLDQHMELDQRMENVHQIGHIASAASGI